MNKHLLIVGMLILLLNVGLSGCQEQTSTVTLEYGTKVYGDTDKVEISNYQVVTQHYYGYPYGDYKNIGNGFIHNVSAERYLISGTVKNVAGEYLSVIKITFKFYDNNNSYLRSDLTYLKNLTNSYEKDFSVCYGKSSSYFQNVDHVTLTIST